MTKVDYQTYKKDIIFTTPGAYTTVEKCEYNNTVVITSDRIEVKTMINTLIIIILLAYLLIYYFLQRNGYELMASLGYVTAGFILMVGYQNQYEWYLIILPLLLSGLYMFYTIVDTIAETMS